MNFQHLIYFQRVAQTENFTQAAKELFITTPALSKAIRGIEEEIGFPLFEKKGRNSYLTENGREFYTVVESAVNTLENGLQQIHDRNGVIRGRLRLAGNWTMCGGYLPQRIKEFNQLHPQVTHFTRFLLTCDILERVEDNSIHLGFCGDFIPEEYPDIARHFLFTEELVLIVPPDHPLASRKSVLFSELRDEAFISFKMITSGGAYESLLGLCSKYGFSPNVVYEMTDDHAIVSTVRIGLGIALVPKNDCLPLDGVVIVPIEGERPVRHQYIIWKKDSYLPPIAKAFRDFIIQHEKETIEAL